MNAITRIACLAVLVLFTPLSNADSVNLLSNPGAETGDMTGWDTFGQVLPYAASPATIPPAHDDGFAPYEGDYYFVGGRDGGGEMAQNINFQGYLGEISAGKAFITAGFWEASLDQGALTDTANLTLSFFDASGNVFEQVFSPQIAFKNEFDPATTVYGNYQMVISVPKQAVEVNYQIGFVLNSGFGSDVDAYVDQTYLSISAVPEPSNLTLASLGLLGISGVLLWRRRAERARTSTKN